MMKKQKIEKSDETFDEAPPVLVPEENTADEEVVIAEDEEVLLLIWCTHVFLLLWVVFQ